MNTKIKLTDIIKECKSIRFETTFILEDFIKSLNVPPTETQFRHDMDRFIKFTDDGKYFTHHSPIKNFVRSSEVDFNA